MFQLCKQYNLNSNFFLTRKQDILIVSIYLPCFYEILWRTTCFDNTDKYELI